MRQALLSPAFKSAPPLGIVLAFGICLLAGFAPGEVHANVYATNIRFNGGTNNVAIGPGGSVLIGYLLNQDATAGVTIRINVGGGATVRTLSLAGGDPGTARGAHSVEWDGLDDNTNPVVSGAYSIQITAAANDLGGWQQINRDSDSGSYVFAPRGIAVNRNTNSVYYGRVFVANAIANPAGVFQPGEAVGILKLNADGSYAEEGASSDGGWPWAGDGFSPWKIEVSDDDYVYIGDFNVTNSGLVARFDQTLSSNSLMAILRSDNGSNSGAVRLSGPFITGQGTNTQVWMADTNASGVGIRRWNVAAGGAIATNDLGVTVVQAGGGLPLDGAPCDVAVDASNRIYTIQSVSDSGVLSYRVFLYPAYTNVTETNATWLVGSGDDTLLGASGIALDPTMTYVAVALQGAGCGGVRIFNAANGADVTTLTPDSSHGHTDVAWDNVGNLYACDDYSQVWRAYSPPGDNAATTVALETVQVSAPPTRPLLSNASYHAGQFNFTLVGQANVTYIIQASINLETNSWVPVLTNTAPDAARPLSLLAPNGASYYRAVVAQ